MKQNFCIPGFAKHAPENLNSCLLKAQVPFRKIFSDWLEASLSERVPADVRAGDLRQKLCRFEGIAVESMDGQYELVWLNPSKQERKTLRQRTF